MKAHQQVIVRSTRNSSGGNIFQFKVPYENVNAMNSFFFSFSLEDRLVWKPWIHRKFLSWLERKLLNEHERPSVLFVLSFYWEIERRHFFCCGCLADKIRWLIILKHFMGDILYKVYFYNFLESELCVAIFYGKLYSIVAFILFFSFHTKNLYRLNWTKRLHLCE